jgi:DNA-binding MarR family transcriptional regulator
MFAMGIMARAAAQSEMRSGFPSAPDGQMEDARIEDARIKPEEMTAAIAANPFALDQKALLALAGTDQAASIARQVADMAQGLAALADRLVGQPGTVAVAGDMAEADCVAFLESQFRIRRLRARHLQGLSLGEPAWDILLDLAVAQYWRRETSVTSLCIAADVPSTTALRWISGMTREGLIVRRPCHRDGRRSFLAIAPATYQAMLALAADALRTAEKVRARYQRGAAA